MLARKNILKVIPYKPGRPIEEVKRELGLKRVIKLASNENPLGPSPLALAAVRRALPDVNRYPDGNCYYLRKRLAAKLNLKPENLIFGNGSDEIIILATRAFLNPGEEVVTSDRTFLIYKLAVLLQDGIGRFVPMRDFRYDLEAMKKAINKKTKLVFIANPDNPHGSYVTQREIERFMSGLPEDLLVFFDEAYFEFAEDEKNFPRTVQYLKRKNVIITRTFSKAYGLSGLRVGYGIASPEVISYMERVREPFNVNSLAQAAACAALDDTGHLRRSKEAVRRGKAFLYENFSRLGLFYVPSAANFILVETGPKTSVICEKLLKDGVIVRDMSAWALNNFLRVTVGKDEENKLFISKLEHILKKV